MLYHEQSEDYRPLFWMGGRPVYVNTLILILHILAFTVVALTVSFLGTGVLSALGLGNYEAVYHGQIWRLVSYIIFPPQTAIMFIFAMGFLFYFGRQVEQFVGRKTYINLYAALVLIPSVLFCLLGLLGFWYENYLGGYSTIFGVFVAFATIYPGVEICIWFVNLTAKGWAYVLLGVLSLANIAYHEWISLGDLWCDAAVGYVGMRLIGAGRGLTWLTDWLEDRQAKRLARQRNLRVLKDAKETESIDDILEKISKHGVGSLDARERAALERARTNLLKRDQH
ncbi:MAG TPA: rhomboid family intramembrane serine protease [Candidatus Methylacidiphilales bacterium]|jgi:membrane associated rhomboid family serine protease|nr:rhomboid family intramembrane serine protease [Candidatus Methylacidiphilales bacterium]